MAARSYRQHSTSTSASASVSSSSDDDSTASSTRTARAAMKTFTIVAVVAVVALAACLAPSSQATPVALSPGGGPEGEDAELVPAPFVEERANRQARATCDLLSFTSKWVSVNHSACAAHCLGMLKGFKGGRCENAICVCRK